MTDAEQEMLDVVDHSVDMVKSMGRATYENIVSAQFGLALRESAILFGSAPIAVILDEIVESLPKLESGWDKAHDLFEMNMSVLADITRLSSEE